MRFSYKKGLETLTNYAFKEGFIGVEIDYHSTYITWKDKTLNDPKKIYIQSGMTLEEKVYYFLHELGHHELRKDWGRYEKQLPVLAHASEIVLKRKNKGKKYTRRNSFHICSLEEEFLAWTEGLKLGKKLGIKINMERWMNLKVKSLKTYIKYYGTLNKKPTE
jgi:hypothetical protein